MIVGIMNPEKPGKQFLLTTEVLERVNHSTIARLFTQSLKLLGEEFDCDNILLFVTDAVAYMLKAGEVLKSLYPKMIHLTCLAHGLNRVAEIVRVKHPDVDTLVASGKKIFRKCPSRLTKYQEQAPELPLPPSPVITRWGKIIIFKYLN